MFNPSHELIHMLTHLTKKTKFTRFIKQGIKNSIVFTIHVFGNTSENQEYFSTFVFILMT